uniref:Uncharacterized protein n=1 Tax=Arion vulgaris TaxID=1028688 RepID=A0A0B7ACH8_9EUPU
MKNQNLVTLYIRPTAAVVDGIKSNMSSSSISRCHFSHQRWVSKAAVSLPEAHLLLDEHP